VARQQLTGVLLVGGASRRFGGPKALAELGGVSLAERGWATLQHTCEEVLAVGKADEGSFPFGVLDDGSEVRAPIAGVVAGLRAATHDVAVFLPVDCPNMTPTALRALASACRDAAVPQTGPLPGAWAKSALAVLERRLASRRLSLRSSYDELAVVQLELPESLLVDVDTPADLARLER
jgi:molybdopterin-guanine dinucleotide biosynthesis protein A